MKNKKQTKKAVAYYRTATTKQSGNTIAVQKNQCRKWAKKNGYKIVGEYEDAGVSGMKPIDRRSLRDAIARCQHNTNPVEALIVTDVDRLSRNINDYYLIKTMLEKSKIKLIETNHHMIVDSVKTEFVKAILAATRDFYLKIERRSHEKSSNL